MSGNICYGLLLLTEGQRKILTGINLFSHLRIHIRTFNENRKLLLVSVLELFATVTATTISNIFNQVKVRKYRKQIMKSWILQKKRTKPTLDTILCVIRLFFGRIKDIRHNLLSRLTDLQVIRKRGRFFQILRPSHNIQTLHSCMLSHFFI